MAETETSAAALSTMGMGSLTIEGQGTLKNVHGQDATSAKAVMDKI